MAQELPNSLSIPLYRPDLSVVDAQTLVAQLGLNPFQDAALVRSWEGAWEERWQRRAVAFADHVEAIRLIKEILGWPAGMGVHVDPLLDPAWREALHGAWLGCDWHDRDADPTVSAGGVVWQQPGMGWWQPAGHARWVLEEISAVPLPVSGVGQGAIQLVNLTGPRILPVGVGALLLSTDGELIETLRQRRSHAPGAAACALGLSLLDSLPERLERRGELVSRYAAMRLRGWARLPSDLAQGRCRECFYLPMRDVAARISLEAFLTKAGIGCGAVHWFRLPAGTPPGWQSWLSQTLAIPLYAALTDQECKRIINRIHRWVERQ
ncbi:MAG: DegT/DnrJ/EryC1/StrS aminotransferase family protein [Magnetococcales bacterium]|nr:DegT/DnrJ/EryC1/StrS aminotransferase family protein [Magnetococcales bacterium]